MIAFGPGDQAKRAELSSNRQTGQADGVRRGANGVHRANGGGLGGTTRMHTEAVLGQGAAGLLKHSLLLMRTRGKVMAREIGDGSSA